MKPFGYHLMVDCYNCNIRKIDDITLCYDFLVSLVDYLEMHKQAPPFIFRTPEEYEDKIGLSGWIPLVESGISIHTLTKERFVSIDIYSCKEFDRKGVSSFVNEFVEADKLEENFVLRGIEYYKK